MPTTTYKRGAYKLCNDPEHKGSRWLLRVYFYVLDRDENGEPRRWASTCMTCMNRYSKKYHKTRIKNHTPKQDHTTTLYEPPQRFRGRKSENRPRPEPHAVEEHNSKSDHKADVEPFRTWLGNKVSEIGISNVARAVGVSQRRVLGLLQTHYVKEGIKYRVKYVELATVAEFMFAFGEFTWELYPDK